MWDACTIFFLTKAKSPSTPPDTLLSFPNRSLPQSPQSQRGGKPSAATGLSPWPAKDSNRKCTHPGAQKVPLTAIAGV